MIDMYVSKSLNNNEPRSNLHGFGPLFRTSIHNYVEKKHIIQNQKGFPMIQECGANNHPV